MNTELENIPVIKNEAAHQFQMEIEGHLAFIQFNEISDRIALVHTEVPQELGGKGVGKILVKKTLQIIKDSGKTVMPYCPFVLAYIKRNPEWRTLVSERFPYLDKL